MQQTGLLNEQPYQPKQLNDLDRRILKEAFRQSRRCKTAWRWNTACDQQTAARLKRAAPELSQQQQTRLDLIKTKVATRSSARLATDRIVVVDVETSGLSLADDHLIAIGAIASMADASPSPTALTCCYGRKWPATRPISWCTASAAPHSATACRRRKRYWPFWKYLDGAPLFAFHSAFDETMLRKAYRKFLGFNFRYAWADLAYLLPELFPKYASKCHALDDGYNVFPSLTMNVTTHWPMLSPQLNLV